MKKEKEHLLPSKIEISIGIVVYITLLIALTFGVSSCSSECEIEQTYTYFQPVYTTIDELRSSVTLTAPQEIESMGKLFYKDGFLYVNEPNKGVHVIDNRDPSNPINQAFIVIPGSFDLAIKENILYSDSYIDLVAIDISSPQEAVEVGRVEEAFIGYNSYGFYVDPELGLVTDWQETSEVSVTESSCEGQSYGWGVYYANGIAVNEVSNFDATTAVSPTNPGIGGSMSRFAITNNHLFVMDQRFFPLKLIYLLAWKLEIDCFLTGALKQYFQKEKIFS